MEKYKLLARNNLSTIVVDYLKDKILSGDYVGGERIVETDVANGLGISRAPVREGIKELVNEGLIRSIPRKGNFVAKFSMEDIMEIFEIRLLLENSVLDIIIEGNKLSAHDIAKLSEIVDEMVAIAQEEEDIVRKTIKVNEKDIEFHSFLWQRSGSNRRMKILQDLHFQIRRAMVIDTKLTADLEKTARDHYDIIKYLECGDSAKCKQALKEHISIVKKMLPKQMVSEEKII